MPVIIRNSLNYSSIAVNSGGAYKWTFDDQATATGGGAFNAGLGNLDQTAPMVQWQWDDLIAPPANKRLVGIDFQYDLSETAVGPGSLVQAYSFLSFDWDTGGSYVTPFTSTYGSPVSPIDDGGGNYFLLSGTTTFRFGLALNSPDWLAIEASAKIGAPDLAVATRIIDYDSPSGPNDYTMRASNMFLYWDTVNSDSSFRSRGSNRGRLLWGVR